MMIDDALLLAFADGELDALTSERVANEIARSADLQRKLEAHQKLKDQLAAHYAPVADEPVPDRFAALLGGAAETSRPEAEVVSLADVRAQRERDARKAQPPRKMAWSSVAAIAATLVLGLAIGNVFGGGAGVDGSSPVAVRNGVMVADGRLSKALETQLASAQASNAVTRIGLTFRTQDGGLCRTFQDAALSGIACRQGDGWRLDQAVSGTAQGTQYRQVSSGDPRITDAVSAMIDGTPMDAQAEKAALAAKWK